MEVKALTATEGKLGFWIASAAKRVVSGIIEKGHADASAFIELCHYLEELDNNMLIPNDDSFDCVFFARGEELSILEVA